MATNEISVIYLEISNKLYVFFCFIDMSQMVKIHCEQRTSMLCKSNHKLLNQPVLIVRGLNFRLEEDALRHSILCSTEPLFYPTESDADSLVGVCRYVTFCVNMRASYILSFCKITICIQEVYYNAVKAERKKMFFFCYTVKE